MTLESNQIPHSACAESCKKEILRLIELCIDGEINPNEEKVLMEKIENCPECRAMLGTHQTYKKFMQMNVERKCCCKEIKAKILQQIEAE